MPSSMELNVAYESLEQMRQLNTELKCQERGIPCFHMEECQTCLLARDPPRSSGCPALSCDQQEEQSNLLQIVQNTGQTLHQQVSSRLGMNHPKKSPPCLICGHPVCRTHQSSAFRRQGITLCGPCERVFEMDYVVDILSGASPLERQRNCDRLMELYDRSVLLLRYSTRFIKEIADALDQSAQTQNRISVGSSSVGIVSGILGVASAVAIFTPAGPPLLIASLLFGGSATVVQTGTEVRLHLSQPNQLADKIIALHGVCWNILKVVDTLRDAVLRDHLRTDLYDTPQQIILADYGSSSTQKKRQQQRQQHRIVTGASTVANLSLGAGRAATVSLEAGGRAATRAAAERAGAMATRSARWMSRTARTVRFARFAGGSLAAATIVLEAHSLSQTLQAMRSGKNCEKADFIRRICGELELLPRTTELETECGRYLETLTHRQHVITQQEVHKLLLENAEIMQRAQEMALMQELQHDAEDESSSAAYSDFGLDQSEKSTSSNRSTSSLMDRIKLFKEQQYQRQQKHQTESMPIDHGDSSIRSDSSSSNEDKDNNDGSTQQKP